MKCIATFYKEKQEFNILEHITDKEYDKIKMLLKNIDKIKLIYSAKIPLIENYKEIVNLIDEYKKDKIEQIIFRYLIIVRIQNFLSSIRGFIDTFQYTLSREYGKESDIYNKFYNEKREAYDKYFSYRFVEILRNCAQHRELPLNFMRESYDGANKIIELIIKKETFMDNKKITQKKKNDINKNCSDEIELMTHLTNMFAYLLNIHKNIFNMAVTPNEVKEFFMYEEKFPHDNGFLTLLRTEEKENESTKFYPDFFNFAIAKEILKIEKDE